MRIPLYLSPSAIGIWQKSREEYYLNYLADDRPPRMPQNHHMAIGSSFDAYVKSWLHEALFGKGKDPKFDLVTIFEAQVEAPQRDQAFEAGRYCFEAYKKSGALADLMLELQNSVGTPRFEIEIKGAINEHREGVTKKMESGVVFLGKPDVFYINKHGQHIILDFKVNGFYSKNPPSPMKGYLQIRSGTGEPILRGSHKDCIPMVVNGTRINCGLYLEDCNRDWAQQLSIYAWLLGAGVGEEFIVAIDQLICTPSSEKYPNIKVAEHRLRISNEHQWKVYAAAQEIWEIIHSNHIFREISLEDSRAKCEMLDMQAKHSQSNDEIFNAMTRG